MKVIRNLCAIHFLKINGILMSFFRITENCAGKVPTWLTNRLTKVIGPKFIKRVHKACLNYENWKQKNQPNWKPWIYPEQQVYLPF